ncbi:MAG: hypothetical protein ACD_75C00801G0001 [uncultured bacterium]|nr:MAG: hypothetical protein ACD_75C00801G0001 [uncultured bacterium]
MPLFPQEMDQQILAFMDFVEFGRNVAQLAFRTDLIKKHRHQFGELFRQIVDRLDRMIEQLGDIPLKQIRVLDTGP